MIRRVYYNMSLSETKRALETVAAMEVTLMKLLWQYQSVKEINMADDRLTKIIRTLLIEKYCLGRDGYELSLRLVATIQGVIGYKNGRICTSPQDLWNLCLTTMFMRLQILFGNIRAVEHVKPAPLFKNDIHIAFVKSRLVK